MAMVWTNTYPTWRATGTSGNDIVTVATDGGMMTNSNWIQMGAGDDYAELDFGQDAFWGEAGNDTAHGGWSSDTLWGDDGDDLLFGEGDNDKLVAGTGSDALYGGIGDDTLNAEVADDEWDNLAGGDGHDSYSIWDSRDVITSEAGYGSGSSYDTIYLNAASYDMNKNADTQAIERLIIERETGANVNGNMYANTLIGGKGFDTIKGDAGNDTIKGNEGEDKLTGGLGDDSLEGGDGYDTLWGSNGTDRMLGGNQSDFLYGGGQNDTIYGGAGDDNAHGGDGNDLIIGDDAGQGFGNFLFGDAGKDTLYGGASSDHLYGGDGDDRLYAGTGDADQLKGGKGNDMYFLEEQTQNVIENADEGQDTILSTALTVYLGNYENVEALFYNGIGGVVTYEGSDHDDVISIYGAANGRIFGRSGDDDMSGSAGNDKLDGGAGNDVMLGLSGDDTLLGAGGNDTMYGGQGNDRYVEVSNQDTVIEAANGGYDTVVVWTAEQNGNYVLSANVEAGVMAGDHLSTLYGNELDNVLSTSGYGGTSLRGMGGNDRLVGTNAYESFYGGTGNDTLTGSGGEDTLNGGSGADLMQGGTGNDTYFVDDAQDRTVESIFGNGVDSVRASVASWTLADDVENLVYVGFGNFAGTGSVGNNRIEGGSLGDTLRGMGGNDVLEGHGGADMIYGGAGADQFIFTNDGAKNTAHVFDFQSGVDRLKLDTDAGWSASYVDADTTRFTSATGGTVIVDGLDIGHVWNSVDFL